MSTSIQTEAGAPGEIFDQPEPARPVKQTSMSRGNAAVRPTNRGKWILTIMALALLAGAAFITGLWVNNPSDGLGASLVGWPGIAWKNLLQNQAQELGSGLAGQTPWIMARVGGIMAYLMSFGSVVLGLMMSSRWKWVRKVLQAPSTFYLHKIMGLLMATFLVIHLTGLLLDTYVKISLFQLLVPFSTTSYRPVWTGLGTIALYGMALVMITAYLANKLGPKVWRSIHYLSFGVFCLSTIHGIMAGTDSEGLWMEGVYLATALVVTVLAALRFTKD